MSDLRKLAEAATPGPWTRLIWDYGETSGRGSMFVTADPVGEQRALASDISPDDAAYIAAASPDVILALLDENERLREAINGFRWVGNNLHNTGTIGFREFYLAALEDARKAMGDNWKPMRMTDD